jgi:DUF438 domain-containing protein
MSEMINNREYRQQVLKEIIKDLHSGKTVEEVKPRFEKLIQGISVQEIVEMEQALVREGMPVEEIQSLCDVHASVFKGSIEEIHREVKPEETPGHPIQVFKAENREIEKFIDYYLKPTLEDFKEEDSEEIRTELLSELNLLWEIDKHYSRKENLLFPYMEKYGITTPPKVMWGVDDEIRAGIKEVRRMLSEYQGNQGEVVEKLEEVINQVLEMIFKEENILFPMVLETLAEDEWEKIAGESGEIGYTLVEPLGKWEPVNINVEEKVKKQGEEPSNDGYVKFETGILSPAEISGILNTLPLDMTFVDKDGSVKYFSQGKERIFARTKAIIGRQVQNCHPPGSVHIVEKIAEDLQSGRKDHEDFWIKMGDKYVYIRYFAVRDEKGEYLGILEVTQDIKPIQEITGEKRLLSE